jgi:hypothetical protein
MHILIGLILLVLVIVFLPGVIIIPVQLLGIAWFGFWRALERDG